MERIVRYNTSNCSKCTLCKWFSNMNLSECQDVNAVKMCNDDYKLLRSRPVKLHNSMYYLSTCCLCWFVCFKVWGLYFWLLFSCQFFHRQNYKSRWHSGSTRAGGKITVEAEKKRKMYEGGENKIFTPTVPTTHRTGLGESPDEHKCKCTILVYVTFGNVIVLCFSL